ncbi:Prolyl endopeptidase precursor [Anatilimnocola aggregata]|uniref:prolyl oligopeptidase n=1 Tax=Anatilimnocola aggregata TaxID=2528021 RepID=A0A517YDK4_9BACT|nr:prolyl oligopeptidase family serine peptidase [Anatilimnocola aggregata]QDU28310.1 Prolyl endopeptidase precursor [Anatilimnocola aggregata]
MSALPLLMRLVLVVACFHSLTYSFAMAEPPPVAPVKTVVDTYHGTTITDHYRYFEDFKNSAVQAWVKQQAEYTERSLEALPGRAALLARIQELDAGIPYTLSGLTRVPSGELFYFKQLAGENVAKLYVRESQRGTERLLIDPEKFPPPAGGGHVTLGFYRVSPDASQLLYGFAASGSEQTTLKIFDRRTGQDLPESIDRIEAEYALPYWLPDGKSFVYSRRRQIGTDAPAADGYKFTQAFQHKLESNPNQDSLVFANGAPGSPPMAEMDFPAVIAPLGSAWAIGQIKHGDETDITLYVTRQESLGSPAPRWTKVCDRTDLVTEFAVHGDDIYLLTAHDAPRFKVVRTSLTHPDFATAEEVVPPSEQVVDSLAVAKDALYVGVLVGVPNKILRVPYASPANAELIELPQDEPAAHITAARADLPGIFLSTRSWTRAGKLYEYEPATGKLTDTALLPTGKFDAPDWLTSTEVMVTSHDAVKVPLSIIHRRDIKLNGLNPTLLSGYGAYGFTASMRFKPTDLAWLERGGVLAVAHVRGGGAFGKEWHHAGRKLTKPNTWKDFIACAEYLVRTGYTSSAKLAGEGGSAGGILIGRSITERPDLFAAAHISVGCTDMLRFETTMNGPPNVPEFGTTTKADEFQGLLAMSTLHHIGDGVKYPAVLLTHGANDPRVEPWISAKTTARLQAASASGKPVLFRVDYHAGHGIGSTRTQQQAEDADISSFLLWQFGDPAFQPRR